MWVRHKHWACARGRPPAKRRPPKYLQHRRCTAVWQHIRGCSSRALAAVRGGGMSGRPGGGPCRPLSLCTASGGRGGRSALQIATRQGGMQAIAKDCCAFKISTPQPEEGTHLLRTLAAGPASRLRPCSRRRRRRRCRRPRSRLWLLREAPCQLAVLAKSLEGHKEALPRRNLALHVLWQGRAGQRRRARRKVFRRQRRLGCRRGAGPRQERQQRR